MKTSRGSIPSRTRAALFGSSLVLLVLAGRGAVPGRAAPPELDFARYELEVGGRISDVAYEDLNGDGRVDILVTRGRELQVFFHGEKGFNVKPDQRWNFDRRAVIFDIMDFEGQGKRSVAFLADGGLYSYDLVGDRFRLVPRLRQKLETLTRRPSNDEIRRKDICRDLDGDGRDDLLIPESSGLGIYKNLGGSFAERKALFAPPAAMLEIGSDQLSSRAQAVYWFSNPAVLDFDKDGRKDLLLPDNEVLKVFPQGPDGNYPLAPTSQFKVPFMKLLAAGQRPGFDLDLTTPLMLEDLNGDGYVDMLSTHIGQGLTRIFMGSKDGIEAFKTPTQTLRAKGVAFFAFMIDLDGDGLQDLVIPRTDKIGVWYILKVLITRTVPIEVLGYYQRKDPARPFPEEPDFVREVEIPILLRSGGDKLEIGTSFLATVNGDFNKDGRKDVLYRTGDTELSIFYGPQERGPFADEASAQISIKDTSRYRALLADVPELNSDGCSDIVIKYYSWDRDEDRITVLISKGAR